MSERMDSTTAPAQELVEHSTRISAAALSTRLQATEAELAQLRVVAVRAAQHAQAIDDDHADGIVATFEALLDAVRAMPEGLYRRLLRGLPWG